MCGVFTAMAAGQVVSEHAYADIITHLLFSGEGQEMYLRSPAQFNIPTGQLVSTCSGNSAMFRWHVKWLRLRLSARLGQLSIQQALPLYPL